MTKTMKKILKFSQYTEGWDYGRGKPFSKKTIKQALVLDRLLRAAGILQTDAFPGSDGDIMVTGYRDSWCWEFTLESDNTVTFITEKNGRIVEEREGISFSGALWAILSLDNSKETPEKTWTHHLYVSSTPKNMTPKEAGLQVWHSSQTIKVEYPPSKWHVYEPERSLSVPTFENIMPKQPELQLCFGNSIPGYYRNIQSSRKTAPQETSVITTFMDSPEEKLGVFS